MLQTDLIDVINGGGAWALLGSGLSTDSGLAGWRRLTEGVVDRLAPVRQALVIADPRYQEAVAREVFPKALGRIESLTNRATLEEAVADILSIEGVVPSPAIRSVASWPFRGYLTGNYDGLLTRALNDVNPGWIPIGNEREEIRRLSGGAEGVVWHFHGALGLAPGRARLILTEADYDDIYLEGSPTSTQLRAYLQLHRLVFFGFGFRDEDFNRLLTLTARFCTPARPAFAFLGGASDAQRAELRERYNVEVVGYPTPGGSHMALGPLLDTYGSFILKRTLQFGRPARPVPSYDPETTGLMTYNELVLRGGARAATSTVSALLRARLLSMLRFQGPLSIAQLSGDLASRAALLSQAAARPAQEQRVTDALTVLRDSDLVSETPGPDVATWALTASGQAEMDSQADKAANLAEQFSASLVGRAQGIIAEPTAAQRVARAAEGFLKDCVQRRALGVAMAQGTSPEHQKYHIVALLQALPEFLAQVEDADEAAALVRLVQEILAERNPSDLRFMGIALQAQFGVNLLGYDEETLRRRLEELANTLFLVDSSTLIFRLAAGSSGHEAALSLLDRLSDVGAPIGTTDLLAIEVSEHARWALEHVSSTDPLGYKALAAVIGQTGYRVNQFLAGYLSEVSEGKSPDLGAYLDRVTGDPEGHKANDQAFRSGLERAGVPCIPFPNWQGFDPALWGDAERLQGEIEQRRVAADTYRHERQVRAEAEALVIVQSVRAGKLAMPGRETRHAYFVSPTRILDDVAGPGSAITMRAEAVLQWMSTVTACPLEELGAITSALIAELDERGLTILDKGRLASVFSPLIEATRDHFSEELSKNRALISERFSNEGIEAIQNASALDLPVAVNSFYRQRAEDLERELVLERTAREGLAERKRIEDRQLADLERLRAAEKQRRTRNTKRRGPGKQKRN